MSDRALPRLGSAPRGARLRTRYRILSALLLLLGLGVAGGFAWAGHVDHEQMMELVRDGALTEGVLYAKERRGGKSKRYELDFRYVVEGRVHTGSGAVDRARFDASEPGTSLLVTYLPREPERSHLGRVDEALARSMRFDRWIVAIVLGGGLLAFGTVMALVFRSRVILLERGHVRDARVTELTTCKKQRVALRYAFRDGEGIERRAKVRLAAATAASAGCTAVGDAVAVLQDPWRPKRFDLVAQVLAFAQCDRLTGRS